MRAYFDAGDYSRVIRFLSQNTPSNMYIKDLLSKLSCEPVLADCDIQNYVLFLLQTLGDCMQAAHDF